MKRLLAFAVVIALGAGAANAKAAYCQDPTTHKRISCKAQAITTESGKSLTTEKGQPITTETPAKKPSMFSGMMKPKPAPTTPMQSPASATPMAPTVSTMASGKKAPNCVRGKLCGNSCIKATDICHKPS
jgi:hypothetical protein